MSRVFLLGVPVDPLTRAEATKRMLALLAADGQAHVVTPNNEMLVQATRDPAFHAVLRDAALALADSTGVVLAARLRGTPLPGRVPGADAVRDLCLRLDEACPVFFLGAGEGVAARAAEELRKANPRLRIAGTYAGSPRPEDAAGIAERVRASGARLLLVAYGSPAQDLWIARHRGEMPGVRVAMGVGGTFDFLAGTVRRAPAVLRGIGLEWAWRFALQPWRAKRMRDAVILFPWLALTRR